MQGDGTNMPFIEVLVNFEQIGFVIQVCAQCLTQRGEPVTGDDHYWTMDFSDDSDLEGLILSKGGSGQRGYSSQSHRSGRHDHDSTVFQRSPNKPGIPPFSESGADGALEIMTGVRDISVADLGVF